MRIIPAFSLLIYLLIAVACPLLAQEGRLLEQQMQQCLPDGAGILLEIADGKLVAFSGKELLQRPASPGSIMKIFTVYALLASGESTRNVYYCPPSSVDTPSTDSCWYKPGHGNMTLKSALAHSCNAWFRQWLTGRNLEPAYSLFSKFGFQFFEPGNAQQAIKLVTGMSSDIKVKPAELAFAAAALFNGGTVYSIRKWQSGSFCLPAKRIAVQKEQVAVIEHAMAEAAGIGTGKAAFPGDISHKIRIKTGTSISSKLNEDGVQVENPLKVDGWCLALFQKQGRSYLLLVYYQGTTGAEKASIAAGQIIRFFLEQT